MATEWYYSHDDQRIGPLSARDFKERIASGQITPSDMVWNESMAEWQEASGVPGLFAKTARSKETASNKELLDQAGHFATAVGRVVTDVVQTQAKGGDDFGHFGGDGEQPAIFLRAEYFGGRTRIGTPLSAMNEIGFMLGTALFSWSYLINFLRTSTSAWQFLPFSRTEFVRINLRQKVLWQRLTPTLAVWTVGMLIVLITAYLVKGQFGFVVMGAGYVAMNVVACKLVTSIAERLTRSQITLEYGFPHKYELLCGFSDAAVEEQIEGVLQLCRAVSKVEFGRWDQFSGHGGGNGLLGAVYSRLSRIGGVD
jgi:hypothetical protein